MRIAVIIDGWEPIVGGGQTQVWELSKRLVESYGYHIDIFTRQLIDESGKKFEKNESFYDGKLKIIRVGPASSFFNFFGRIFTVFSIAHRVIIEHNKNSYSLIHTHVYLGAISGKIARFFTTLPLILTVHGVNLTDANARGISAWLEKQICIKWHYDKIIAVGKGYLRYKKNDPDILLIPNGVDIKKFDLIKTDINNKTFKALFVGRLDWTKGLEILLRAVYLLKKNHPSLLSEKKFSLHIVGYGYDQKKYNLLVNDFHLNDLVKMRGKIIGDDLIHEYKSSDLFILPSLTEGDSITIKEAWASRVPVLSTRSGGPEYYIENGTDGFLVDGNNPEKLAGIIREILGYSKDELKQMGIRGYDKVRRSYSWDMSAKKTHEVYQNIIQK